MQEEHCAPFFGGVRSWFAFFDGNVKLPSRELTYPIWGIGKSSSKVFFKRRYVSFQEGRWWNFILFWVSQPKIGEDSHFDSYFSDGFESPIRKSLSHDLKPVDGNQKSGREKPVELGSLWFNSCFTTGKREKNITKQKATTSVVEGVSYESWESCTKVAENLGSPTIPVVKEGFP